MSNRPGRLGEAERRDLAGFVAEMRGRGMRWKTLERICNLSAKQLRRLMSQNSPLMSHPSDCRTDIAA